MNQYASLGRRLLALLLDSLILLIPCAIASHVIPFIGGVLVWFLYAPILEASETQATVGKYLVGIQVADINGGRISFRASLIRNLLKLVSGILLFIGFFVALFSSKKQALHDMLADTTVVYGRYERTFGEAWLGSVKDFFSTIGLTESRPSEKSSEGQQNDTLAKLERLQNLRDKGTLTEEEFQKQKKLILEEKA